MTEISKTMPAWLRISYMISGSIAGTFALLVMFSWFFSEMTIILFLGIAVLLISITRLLIGVYDMNYSMWNKAFNIVVGLILLPIAVILIARLSSNLAFLIIFLSISVMILGIINIVTGFESDNRVSWFRIYLILNGFALIALSYLSATLGFLAEKYLLMITGGGYLLLGIRRFLEGYLGNKIIKTSGKKSK
jgi:uncharacterized membrane protein HdeD (DUF308 family)